MKFESLLSTGAERGSGPLSGCQRASTLQRDRTARWTQISLGLAAGVLLTSFDSAGATEVDAERCLAAEALVIYIAHGSAAALGGSAYNLGSHSEVIAGWANKTPHPRPLADVLEKLEVQPAKSVLKCPGVEAVANEAGLIIHNESANIPMGIYTAHASVPILSSDGLTGAAVVNTEMRGHGVTQIVMLVKEQGRWKVNGQVIVSFS